MPAFNAGATIEKVFSRIPEEAKQRIQRYVVVNDGSTDDTDEAIRRLCRIYPHIIYLRHQNNRGYGAAEKTLLNCAVKEGAELVILLHSDGQYSPEKIPNKKSIDIFIPSSPLAVKVGMKTGLPLIPRARGHL